MPIRVRSITRSSKGDTLYTIALDHGLDYKELAEWNKLDNPNVIRVGQQLRLRAPVIRRGDRAAEVCTGRGRAAGWQRAAGGRRERSG